MAGSTARQVRKRPAGRQVGELGAEWLRGSDPNLIGRLGAIADSKTGEQRAGRQDCPPNPRESKSSKGCPQIPAADVMSVASDWSSAAGWESTATRKRVEAGLRRAKRATPSTLAFQAPPAALKPFR